MKRDALKHLLEWKNDPHRKPLVLQGARQVGKTWLMKEFGRLYYNKTAYISFNDTREAAELFSGSYNVQDMMLALGVLSGVNITAKNTLIILDEVQECPRALNALKFLHENAPEYHVIVAGSLLGVAVKHRDFSFPVGQVDFLRIQPMTFGEYLEAVGAEDLRNLAREGRTNVIRLVKDRFITRLREYMYVGGMPEAVAHYAANKDLSAVRRIQNQILESYSQDFAKYTQPRNIPRIAAVWNSLPSQLARENKKYTYKGIAPGARAREYEDAIEWLSLYGLVHRVRRIAKPALPISSYADDSAFKLYMIDVGLLGAAARLDAAALLSNMGIFEEFKGALTEQYVLQQLLAQQNIDVAYWTAANGTAEVDFIIQSHNEIIPVEVKASTNLRARSLASYRQRYEPAKAFRISLSDWEINGGLCNIPLYLADCINTLWDIL